VLATPETPYSEALMAVLKAIDEEPMIRKMFEKALRKNGMSSLIGAFMIRSATRS
jgi:hypothetical protein